MNDPASQGTYPPRQTSDPDTASGTPRSRSYLSQTARPSANSQSIFLRLDFVSTQKPCQSFALKRSFIAFSNKTTIHVTLAHLIFCFTSLQYLTLGSKGHCSSSFQVKKCEKYDRIKENADEVFSCHTAPIKASSFPYLTGACA